MADGGLRAALRFRQLKHARAAGAGRCRGGRAARRHRPQGVHPSYTAALAPAVAGVVAVTASLLWRTRTTWFSRVAAAVLVAVTVGWDVHLLDRTPTFLPWLRWVLPVAAALAVVGLLVGPRLRWRRAAAVVATVAVLAGIGAHGAYALDTASTPHTGSIPSSGPVASQIGGGGTGGGFGGQAPTGTRPTGTAPTGTAPTGTGTSAGATGTTGGTAAGGQDGGQASSALVALLSASTTRWAAATVGSQSAAPLPLASGRAVMSIGGSTGSVAWPTLAQFEADVAAGEAHYFVAGVGTGGGGAGGGSSSTASQITARVEAHYTATTVGGQTVYDLTAATTG